MGTGHAASGFAAGAAGAAWGLPALGVSLNPTGTVALTLSVMLAGHCLTPDIDHERATASNAFGPVSRVVHKMAAGGSYAFTKATGTKYDKPKPHRGLTHALPFHILLAIVVTLLGQLWPAATGALVFGTAVGMLVKLAGRPWQSSLAGLAAAVLYVLSSPHIQLPAPWAIGLAVGMGCALHSLGDMVTRQGVPFLAPLVTVIGKRWYDFRPPLFLTFRAGGPFEKVLVVGFLATASLALAHSTGVF